MKDIIIIGGGIAGLTAAVYALRSGKSVLLFEKKAYGGQISQSHAVENYPGFPEPVNGVELMNAIELSGWKGGVRVELPVDEDEYLAELNKRRATSRLKVVDETKVADTTGTF